MTTSPATSLSGAIESARGRLQGWTDERASRRPTPGTWSAKEILGHLIDSASNNHQRFVRARFQEDLVFEGYNQDGWVEAQGYAHAPWTDLIELWLAFNSHLARVMSETPREVLERPRVQHNLDQIAWRTVPADEPTTLRYFMEDYVGHLRHHLEQIFAL